MTEEKAKTHGPVCEYCEENDGKWYCNDCAKFLCRTCNKAHPKLLQYKDKMQHKVISVAEKMEV